MESFPNSSWNPERAVSFFQPFATEQLQNGLFNAYIATAQQQINSDPEGESMLQASLFAEAPLVVLLEADTDDPAQPKSVVLAKLDLSNGNIIEGSSVHTSVSLDQHSWELTVDDSGFFDDEHADFMRGQHFQQTMSGFEFSDTMK